MRRKRFQKGSLQKRLSGGHYVWLVMWREAEKRPSKTLGRCADLTKSQAQQMLARILEPINQGVQSRTNRAITFEDFVDGVFLPHKRLGWKESTAMTSEQIIQSHLMPDLGQRLLQSIHRTDLQALLARKAPTHSQSVINHLRWLLKDIFGLQYRMVC